MGVLWLCGLLGCALPSGNKVGNGPAVVAVPVAGTIAPGTKILLSPAVPADIVYTLDGSKPERDKGTAYTEPFVLWSAVTVRAVAFSKEGVPGPESQFVYQVDQLPPQTTASPKGGNVKAALKVELSSDEPATIYYTTDGTKPTTRSRVYRDAIDIARDTVLQYFAVDAWGNREAVQSEVYNFPPQVSVWPPSGVYEGKDLTLYLSTSKPAQIFYSYAHLAPNYWFLYRNPFRLRFDTEIRVKAVDVSGAETESGTYLYAFLSPLQRGALQIQEREPLAMVTIDPEGFGQPAVFLAGSSALSMLPYTASGPQASRQLTPLTSKTRWMRSWDLDGDGLQDLILADDKDQLSVLLALTKQAFNLDNSLLALPKEAQPAEVVPLDFDADGQLDLFVLDRRAKESRLWRRVGSRYTAEKESVGVVDKDARAALSGDWNGDGFPDLLILPGGKTYPYLLYGDGKGVFQVYTLKELLQKVGEDISWLHAARTDFDGDGDLDLVLVGRMTKILDPKTRESVTVLVLVLLHQLGGQGWKLVYHTSLTDRPLRSVMLLDVDADSYPDLFLASSNGTRSVLLKNVLGTRFLDATAISSVLWKEAGPVSVGDLSGSGSASLLLAGQSGFLRVYGQKPRGKFLRLVIQGVRGNRSAIGARVQITVDDRKLLREVGLRSTSPDQHDLTLSIGLGDPEKIGPLIVRWPDGQSREIPDPTPNQTLILPPQP